MYLKNLNQEQARTKEDIEKEYTPVCNDYFLLLNVDLTVVSFNYSATELFKGEESLMAGVKFEEIKTSPELTPLYKMVVNALAGFTSQQEFLITTSKENNWIRFTVSPHYNSDKKTIGVACIGTNVKNEKLQEEKLKTQQSVLQAIAQIYSHQVRHPLTNILAIIDLIKAGDTDSTMTYLPHLETASKELDAIIRNVVLASAQAA